MSSSDGDTDHGRRCEKCGEPGEVRDIWTHVGHGFGGELEWRETWCDDCRPLEDEITAMELVATAAGSCGWVLEGSSQHQQALETVQRLAS